MLDLVSWMLGGALAAPCHTALGVAVTAVSEGNKRLAKHLETQEVTDMERTELGFGSADPMEGMKNDCLSMTMELFGVYRALCLRGNPTMTDVQMEELADIEARLEKLMEGRRWQCRSPPPCSS